jgi:hypothetical protein
MVSPMHRPLIMATHTIDYDAEFTRRVVRHEQHLKWSLLAFAIAVLVAAVTWAMFLRYV